MNDRLSISQMKAWDYGLDPHEMDKLSKELGVNVKYWNKINDSGLIIEIMESDRSNNPDIGISILFLTRSTWSDHQNYTYYKQFIKPNPVLMNEGNTVVINKDLTLDHLALQIFNDKFIKILRFILDNIKTHKDYPMIRSSKRYYSMEMMGSTPENHHINITVSNRSMYDGRGLI